MAPLKIYNREDGYYYIYPGVNGATRNSIESAVPCERVLRQHVGKFVNFHYLKFKVAELETFKIWAKQTKTPLFGDLS